MQGVTLNIPLRYLHSHPGNPRKDLGDISELTESIRAKGILQPLTIIPIMANGEMTDDYTGLIGHRRMAAAKAAGLSEAPCVLITEEVSQKEQLEIMLMENIQRSNLSIYEEALGFQQLLDFGANIDEISAKSGFSTSTVRRRLEIAKLDKEKLKEACVRQPNLADFVRLAEIKNIDTRNKVLESIGTKDFNFKLSAAINQEKEAEKLPQIKAVLRELKMNKLPESERYSSKWERILNFYVCDYNDKYRKKLQKTQSTEKCWYDISFRQVEIYVKKKKAEPIKRTQEELEANKLIRQKWAQLEMLAKDCYQLRKDFVMKLSYTRSNAMDILKGALIAGVYNEANYNSSDRDLLVQTLFNVANEGCTFSGEMRDKRMDAKYYMDIDDSNMPKLAYALFGDSAKETCSTDYKHALPAYKKDGKLELLYQWLESLGYKPANEEQQLLNGTHPVFQEELKL